MCSKVTIKQNLIIIHKPNHWREIRDQLINEFGPSIVIRSRMRRELGFTVREHRQWISNIYDAKKHRELGYYQDQVHLDFYNDAAQSWFQLRYL